jgi:invasion protein IalB
MKLKSSLAGAVALLGLTTIASAQQAAPTTTRHGDFLVRCFPVQTGSPCDLYEELINRDTNQRVVTFSIAFLPATNRYVMVLGVPLGVALEKGVVIQTNTFTTPTMTFRRCDQGGCYVEAQVDKPLIDAFMGSSGEAKLRISAEGEDKPRELPLSFNGFTAAHNDMVAQNRAKAVKPGAEAAPAATPAQ